MKIKMDLTISILSFFLCYSMPLAKTTDLNLVTLKSGCKTSKLTSRVSIQNAALVDFRFSRVPSCGVDSELTITEDETKGDIYIEVEAGFPTYFYQLIDTNLTDTDLLDDIVIATSGLTINNNFTFKNVDPNTRFKVRVFSNNEAPIDITTEIPVTNNSIIETSTIETNKVINIEATLEIIKPVTCTPGEIKVTLSVPGDPSFDLSAVDFEIAELGIGGTGNLSTFLIDDITNEPDPLTNPTLPPNLVFADLLSVSNFTIIIPSNPSCVPVNPFLNSLVPFNGIEPNAQTEFSCAEGTSVTFTANNLSTSGSYISPYANTTTATALEYRIVSAPTNTPAFIFEPQESPVFSNLEQGDYAYTVTDITNPMDTCSSEAFSLSIVEPTLPEISNVITYTDNTSIIVYFKVINSVSLDFIEVAASDIIFVSPSLISGDNFSRYGDPDFPTLSGVDNSNLFAITGVDFNIALEIVIRDSISDCSYSRIVFTPDNPTLSIQNFKNSNINEVIFFPNPAKEKISFTEKINEVRLISVTGELIQVFYTTEKINVSNLEKGMYFLQILNFGKKDILRKLIIE